MGMSHTLRVFRPHRTPPEQLEKTFVARGPLLQEILNKLEKWQPGKSRQHYLIIGPRGIGKTNLLRLIEYNIERKSPPGNKWNSISLSEDAYGITKTADLLVEALRILSDKTNDKNITDAYDKVKYDDNDDRVTDLSLDAFREFHKKNGCGILLMVENVNRVLENQIKIKREIHLLRKILIEEEWIILICTSPTYLNAVTKPEEPLFEFFEVKFLEELSPGEQQEMLRKIALLENNTDFIEHYLDKLKPQLQALYHFTGGNPRLTIMLYDLVANQHISDVKDELDGLLDKLTPFYQDRMKEIAQQEARLLEKMALMPVGCTPTELAKESRMPHKNVSALLTRLERTGYVRREPRRKKQTVYIIPERFFRIWHQMNHSRSARGRVQYLLEFFISWYATPEERDQVWEKLSDTFQVVLQENEEDRIEELSEYMQYIEEISEEREKYGRLFDRLHKIWSYKGFYAIKDEMDDLDKHYQNDGNYFYNKGIFLFRKLKRKKGALSAFRMANKLMPNNILVLFNLKFFVRKDRGGKIHQQIIKLIRTKKHFDSKIKDEDMLLEIFQDEEDSQIVRIVSHLLTKYPDEEVIDKVINIIQTSESSFKKQVGITSLGFFKLKRTVPVIIDFLKNEANNVRGSAASALGRIGSELAVSALIGCLKDEDNIVRGSAAKALGRIGSELAVSALIGCLKDEDNIVRGIVAKALGCIGSELAVGALIDSLKDEAKNVRISSIIALGNITLKKPIQHLDKVIQLLIEIKTDKSFYVSKQVFRNLLDSGFCSSDIEMIEALVEHARKGFKNGEEIFKPYIIAVEYIKSHRDPAIIERQHPEMREAVQLLVDSFDKVER
ncbi:MAG: HEAT repeat domain-containing protein [Candidatus Aminicenantes bacterium]|nr:MAG: HEAT repeat domain-containing protein [Candidatus Aminicenantes bacterium]